MSRALDDDIKKQLLKDDHEAIFTSIAGALCREDGALLDIELLGRSYPLTPGSYYLQEDNAIAIAKLRLVQAFVYALHKMKAHQKSITSLTNEELLQATAVMLLMDPEHLTAANARKRCITAAAQAEKEILMARDKILIDSLLTSRLHRHTKSPVLWAHREWLLLEHERQGMAVDHSSDFTSVILVSAERHPRNYYAWSHARFVTEKGWLDGPQALAHTRTWCWKHHDDISGWSCLAELLKKNTECAEDTIKQTLDFALSFHWRNESVWHFLKTVLPAAWRRDSFNARQQLRETQVELSKNADKQDLFVMNRCVQWVDDFWGMHRHD